MLRPVLLTVLLAAAAAAQPAEIVERDGIPRTASLLEQGVPVPPMSDAEARSLTLRGVPSFIEPEAHDQNGKVSWVRVGALVKMPANGRLPVRLEKGATQAARLTLTRAGGTITAETDRKSTRLNSSHQKI